MSTEAPSPLPIVFIHGMWMTPLSWEHWIERYRARGHEVHAPAWPGLEGDVEELRRDPAPLRGLGVKEIVDHYERSSAGSTARRSSSATPSAGSTHSSSSIAGSAPPARRSARARRRAS